MKKAIIGKKVGMTQVFDEAGKVVPVTVIEAGPCVVVQKKKTEKDGYDAVQLGFGDVSAKHVNKPEQGHFKKNDVAFKKTLKEFRLDDTSALNTGDIVKADVFAEGDVIDVVGTSKGKGFQGVVKRHGFGGVGQSTHGQHNRLRAPGAIGACSYPAKVFKGLRMAGHIVTVQNLQVIKVMPEHNLLVIKGSVPGAKGSIVLVEK